LTPNRSDAESAPHRADALVGHPDRVELPCPEQLRERARVEAVSLRPRLADAGVRRRDHDHARDARFDDARDLPGVAGHLERDVVMHVEALREQLERLGLRLDPAARAQLTLFDDRHLAEVTVNIQRHCSHLVLLAVDDTGRTGGQTTSTDPRSQRNRASRRGGH